MALYSAINEIHIKNRPTIITCIAYSVYLYTLNYGVLMWISFDSALVIAFPTAWTLDTNH